MGSSGVIALFERQARSSVVPKRTGNLFTSDEKRNSYFLVSDSSAASGSHPANPVDGGSNGSRTQQHGYPCCYR